MHRDYGRVCRQLTASLNGLLLTYGSDLRPQLPTTHKALRSYVKHAWTAHTNVPVKVGFPTFIQAAMLWHYTFAATGASHTLADVLQATLVGMCHTDHQQVLDLQQHP